MEWGFTYIAIYVVCIKMSTPCIALMLLQIIVSNWKEGQRNIITHCCLHLVLHYKCNKQNTKFIYVICLCHYVMIYEGSLSCDYQLLRKRGSGDVFQLLLMDPRNFPRWQKRSGWWGKGMKRQIVVNEDEWLRDWVAQDFDTKAPLLLLRSWAALSFKVSLSVFFNQ